MGYHNKKVLSFLKAFFVVCAHSLKTYFCQKLNKMEVSIEQSWKERLQGEFDKPYFKTLTDFVRDEYRTNVVYPPGKLIFNAFNLCPFNDVKVVIIGQPIPLSRY